jgi:tetratricopeptide (TPR) repeat protein
VGFFDRLRRVLPGRAPAESFARGTYELDRGRLELAAAAFEAALAEVQDGAALALVRNKRAIVAIQRGDRPAAVTELVLALEADPRSAAAITTIGNLLLEDGHVEDAMAHFESALVADDGYAPAYHNLGVALHRAGRRSEAVRMLRKARRLETRIRR